MKGKYISITFDKAVKWFNSGNTELKNLALQAYNEKELINNFKDITTFKKACEVLGINYDIKSITIKDIAIDSRASAAMCKLNIIRKALNLGYELSLTEDPKDSYFYYPFNPFVTNYSTSYKCALDSDEMEIIGIIKSNGVQYCVLGGYANDHSSVGLGYFNYQYGVGSAKASAGFLGCATEEIAEHFGKYFGMLITEAKYGDIIKDFIIVKDKYGNTR